MTINPIYFKLDDKDIAVRIVMNLTFHWINYAYTVSFLQSYTIEGLSVFTQYLVSIKVYNPEGAGPETIVVVMTDEGGKFEVNVGVNFSF